MIADFFTKPLQGELFRKLRAVIMGHVSLETFMSEVSVASKERVGDSKCEVHEQPTEMSQTDKESKTVSWGLSEERAAHDVVQEHSMAQAVMSYADAVKKQTVRVDKRSTGGNVPTSQDVDRQGGSRGEIILLS